MAEERRKSSRFQSPGLKSNLSDGGSAFSVVIDDVSTTGVSVSQVPEGFDETDITLHSKQQALQLGVLSLHIRAPKDYVDKLYPRFLRGEGPIEFGNLFGDLGSRAGNQNEQKS